MLKFKPLFWGGRIYHYKMSPDFKTKTKNPLRAENTHLQSQHPCNREVIQNQQKAYSGRE